jgi:hypothetical protein
MGTPFFERLLAATRTTGTCSLLIFLSDFCGYGASISLLLYQDFGGSQGDSDSASGESNDDELQFFIRVFWGCGGAITAVSLFAGAYFMRRLPSHESGIVGERAHESVV